MRTDRTDQARRAAIVFYDADCRFCRWAMGWVLRLDHRRALRPVSLDSAEADERLAHLTAEDRFASWHLAVDGSPVLSGGVAIPPLAGHMAGSVRLEGVLRGLDGPLDVAYRAVARRRGRLGRLVSDPAEHRAVRLIEERTTE